MEKKRERRKEQREGEGKREGEQGKEVYIYDIKTYLLLLRDIIK